MVPCTDKYDKVGKKRLRKIHIRVNYLAEEYGFTGKPSYKIHPLCSCCARKLKPHDRFEVDVDYQTRSVYIRCSGLPWLCRAKLIGGRRMIFNPYRLMKKQMYNGILQNLVCGDCAKNVIYQMEKFNMNLVSQQLHMQTAAHIAEYVVYTNYKPHLLKDDVFPVPPVGYDNFEIKTPAQIENNDGKEVVDPDEIENVGYEVCNWKPQLNDMLVHKDIVNNRNWENIQSELNNEWGGEHFQHR